MYAYQFDEGLTLTMSSTTLSVICRTFCTAVIALNTARDRKISCELVSIWRQDKTGGKTVTARSVDRVSDAPAPFAALETTDNGEYFDTKNFVKSEVGTLENRLRTR